MVKREKSPEIEEDVILYAAWNPYPLNGNLDLEDHRKECARWVMEIVGRNYLMNIYDKPSSRGTILLEISKSFENKHLLLGEHKWSQILKTPTKEEKPNKTCIFYSIYPTCRHANKDGWRAVDLPQEWFYEWSQGKGRFVKPFPKPVYCELPPEDKTGKPICRPLPVQFKPSQPKVDQRPPPPVVGSSAWVGRKHEGGPGPTSASPTKAIKQRPLIITSPTSPILSRSPTEKKTPTSSRSPNLSPAYGPPGPLPVVNLPKGKMSLQQFRIHDQSSNAKKGPAWTTSGVQRSSSAKSADKSPTLEQVPTKPTKPKNAWAKPLAIVPEKPAKTISPVPENNWNEPKTASWADQVEEEGIFDKPNSRSPSPDLSLTETNDAEDIYADPSSSDDEEGLAVRIAADSLVQQMPTSAEPSTGAPKEQKIVCPTHGTICPKHICIDYQKLDLPRRREQRRAERERIRKENQERRRRKNDQRNSGSDEHESGEDSDKSKSSASK